MLQDISALISQLQWLQDSLQIDLSAIIAVLMMIWFQILLMFGDR